MNPTYDASGAELDRYVHAVADAVLDALVPDPSTQAHPIDGPVPAPPALTRRPLCRSGKNPGMAERPSGTTRSEPSARGALDADAAAIGSSGC